LENNTQEEEKERVLIARKCSDMFVINSDIYSFKCWYKDSNQIKMGKKNEEAHLVHEEENSDLD